MVESVDFTHISLNSFFPPTQHSVHPSPALDRLLAHLVALAANNACTEAPHPSSTSSPSPAATAVVDDDCVLDLDLARRLLVWLRRLREKEKGKGVGAGASDGRGTAQRLAEGLVGLGQRQGWSYDVMEGLRQLAKSLPAAGAGVAAATVERQEEEAEEEGDEI